MLHMFIVIFFCYFSSVFNEWLLYVDEQSVVPECVAGDFPEQQPGPLTHYVPPHNEEEKEVKGPTLHIVSPVFPM
jgi:hypothetical protein